MDAPSSIGRGPRRIERGLSIRVVVGEINARDVTTRVVVPSGAQTAWPPFARVAETIATPRRPFPRHRHEGSEVLTYVIEGSASYAIEPGPPRPLTAGTIMLLTAPAAVSHAINPEKGSTVRWFSIVAALPSGASPTPRLQSARAEATELQAEGTVVRPLVGPGSALTSAMGLEAAEIDCRAPGASFRRIGHDRVAVCYALGGRGRLDNERLEGGQAALVENVAGIALQGQSDFRVVLVTAPRVPSTNVAPVGSA